MLNIKKIRERNGLTQTELASRLNVTAASISQYENGKREPNIEKLKDISKVLNITVDELLGIKKTNTSRPPRQVADVGFND